jgi:importin subunit beta-1
MSDAEVWAQIQNNITDVLVRAHNAQNKADSEAAVKQYQEWEERYFPMFLTALAIVLADDTQTGSDARQVAGILLRGCVVGREEERREYVERRWAEVPMDARQEIKQQLWKTMSCPETKFRHHAANAVAAIATLDLKTDSWVDVVPNLASGVNNEQTSGEFKEACLIALSEICTDAHPKHIEPFSFDILLAILTAMASPHTELQVAALKALANAIQFSDKNFDKEDQRDPIMSQVMKMAENANEAVRVAAFDCLVNIATAFYKYLPTYMRLGLKDLTLGAISNDTSEDAAMLAIEFWSTICEEESNIMRDNLAALDVDEALRIEMHNFIKGAAAELAGPLFQGLAKGDLDPNLTTVTIASAASACISLMATTLGNEVVDHFVSMVSATVNSADEQMRDAAMLCFGSILDGPESSVLGGIVNEALPVFFERLVDESAIVKRTTAWCLARLAQFHPATLEPHLADFLRVVAASLSDTADTPMIAACCAEAIDNLASHVTEDMRETSPIVPYLGDLFEALVVAESQPAVETEPSLRLAIFSAIRSLVQATPDPAIELIHTALNTFLPRLRNSAGSNPELECELVGITAACIRRLGPMIGDAVPELMRLYLDLLTHYNGHSSMFQDVFMALGSVVNAIGESFLEYMDEFGAFLNIGLQQYQDIDLFTQAVDLVSALCFALGDKFSPWCPSVIKIFKEHLEKPDMPLQLGPVIMNGYSDLIYVLGPQFADYLGVVLQLLERFLPQALQKTDNLLEWEEIDAVNLWRCGILAVYIQIIQNCVEDHSASIRPHISNMTRLLTTIQEDTTRDDAVNRFACGLIYDIATNFPNIVTTLRRYDPFLDYCRYAQASDERTITAAENAIDRLNR